MSSILNISHYILETKVLGPYIRSAIWVNGCCFNCSGCIAEKMNAKAPVQTSVNELVDVFSGVNSTEGISISGGEPFLQASAILEMVNGIKKNRDYGVIVYTGFTLEELRGKKDKAINDLLDSIDILIDGKYKKELDDGKPFRGSSNQRIIMLSDRYRDVYEDYYLGHSKRDIEIRFDKDRIYMVGVPSKYGIHVWEELKRKADGNA